MPNPEAIAPSMDIWMKQKDASHGGKGTLIAVSSILYHSQNCRKVDSISLNYLNNSKVAEDFTNMEGCIYRVFYTE